MLVLIVDDNPSVRRLLRRALHECTEDIHEAVDGVEGLQSYVQQRPDVVLMDIRMPRMDGLTCTREICRRDPRAKVIVVTDHEDADMQFAARSAGACSFVSKHDLTGLASLVHSLQE